MVGLLLAVQMNSVTTGNQTRDDDLRSDNFFAAATYPVMTTRSFIPSGGWNSPRHEVDWCPTPKKPRELHGDSLLRHTDKIAAPGGC